MYARIKKAGPYSYVQIVESYWEGGRSRQRVVATLGRTEELEEAGKLDALLESLGRYCERAVVLSELQRGEVPVVASRRIGAGLVFERLWQETGCREVAEQLLGGRLFQFPLERAIFLTVLHRLFAPGSDRAAERWRRAYLLEGTEDLQLSHLYRAMAWLGEELPADEQADATPFAPRCVKDRFEELLFARGRNLFSSRELDLVFFDTTTLYFEGEGGTVLGRRGHSKDRRPDRHQIVVGVVLDRESNPLCCEIWPGNTADVTTLVPLAKRLQNRFGIERICVVTDRGMISKKTLGELEGLGWQYILGARMRSQKEVSEEVLSRAGRYQVVREESPLGKGPEPLKVKDVQVDERRYVVCLNEAQARKEAREREAILEALEDKLRQGPRQFIGNRGYRKYLKVVGGHMEVDRQAVEREARFDGKWVLRTNTTLATAEVALRYKQLLEVEAFHRSMKSVLDTRPIYHQSDAAIRGHVFCSFLGLVLRKALGDRLAAKGKQVEWKDVVRDLDRLTETEICKQGKTFVVRDQLTGVAGAVLQAVGVAAPQTIRQLSLPKDQEAAC